MLLCSIVSVKHIHTIISCTLALSVLNRALYLCLQALRRDEVTAPICPCLEVLKNLHKTSLVYVYAAGGYE